MADSEITLEDLSKLKVAELKKICKEKSLATSGTKAELLARLQEAIELQADTGTSDGEAGEEINLEDTLEAEVSVEEDKDLLDESAEEPAIKKIALETEKSEEPELAESKIVLSKGLTDEERLKKRCEKFGVQSEEARKKLRAERFGVAQTEAKEGEKISSTPVTSSDLDKLKQRAARFGSVVSNQLSKLEDNDKLLKRKERFGSVLTSSNTNDKITVNSTLSAGDIEKKKKRAERFGLT